MRHSLTALVASTALLIAAAQGDPTWPSEIDELEEIMFHMMEFKTRNFADTILPCTNEASGPGRQNAAEWLRLGFHDMSTADVDAGVGGLDGSIQYELDTGESLGPGFQTTLEFMSGFYTSRSSISDLIALGVYASVRSCGGLPVPIRAGRIDSSGPGPLGVPQPEHSVEMFREQFRRMGFSNAEMIQVTACGHTIGGVHDTEFPELVVAGEAPSDTTVAGFDEKVITEYLEDNTTNPLVVGPAVGYGKDSDAKIFGSDGNVTVKAMAEPNEFQRVCQQVLQKMIDVVPPSVVLTDPIQPYMVKPVDLQLALNKGASRMLFTGLIRVKTTDLDFNSIDHVRLDYKDRDGGSNCGGGSCSIKAIGRGTGYGLDDSFGFFPIEATIPTESGISSFVITLVLTNGTSLYFDNNGQTYPLQDAIMLMHPQSCLIQHNGQTTVTAAVRNDRAHLPAYLFISYKVPREGLPVAGLHNMTMSMKKGDCVGAYTLYSASWTIPGGISHSARIDVISGDAEVGDMVIADSFKHAVELPGTCQDFSGPPASMCTTLAVSAPASTAAPSAAAPTTMMTRTSALARPTDSPDSTGITVAPTESDREMDEFTLTHAVTSFVGYWVNYAVNYFWGYDRYQMVNHQFDRTT